MDSTAEQIAEQVAAHLRLLDRVDPDTLGEAELRAAVLALMHLDTRIAAVRARLLARWQASGCWRADGSRSAAARLARDANRSLRAARRELRRADALACMPAAAEAYGSGEIGGDHLDTLARADQPSRHAQFAESEGELVGFCRDFRFSEAKQLIEHWVHVVDPDATERRGRDLLDKTSLNTAVTYQDSVHVEGLLDPVGGAMFHAELHRLANELRLHDQRDGMERSAAARRAAALVEMATRSAACGHRDKRPEPLVMVLVGGQTLEHLCKLSTGAVIAPNLVVPHLDRARIQTIVFGDDHQPLTVSRERSFRGRLRRAIQARDQHCQHPSGCDVPLDHCDVDHVIPYAMSGDTSLQNSRLLCPTHNRHPDLRSRAPTGGAQRGSGSGISAEADPFTSEAISS